MQICESATSGLLILQNLVGIKEEICRFPLDVKKLSASGDWGLRP